MTNFGRGTGSYGGNSGAGSHSSFFAPNNFNPRTNGSNGGNSSNGKGNDRKGAPVDKEIEDVQAERGE